MQVIPLSMIMENLRLHLLPSGVFYDHTTSIIGNGVALNIPYLIKEMNESGVQVVCRQPKILVSNRAQILMPYHMLLDACEEATSCRKVLWFYKIRNCTVLF